jgi:Flp pilus assembly protein TadB
LSGLPPSLAAAMFVVAPQQMKILTEDALGIQMIIVGLSLQVIGTIIIRKLVNIRY